MEAAGPRLSRQPDELIIYKRHASCFFGTNLVAQLIGAKVDTLIITGCSTSGCVISTAGDSFAYGFHTIVVEEAVTDRDPNSAVYALVSMDAKWADVVSLNNTIEAIAKLNKKVSPSRKRGSRSS